MQLTTLTSLVVLAPLLVPHTPAAVPHTAVTQVPAQAPPVALPPLSPCPAFLGPQCDSVQHQRLATGQGIAGLALGN